MSGVNCLKSSLIAVSMNGGDDGRYIEHLFKQVISHRLYTAFLLQFMHICELYSFIDLLC